MDHLLGEDLYYDDSYVSAIDHEHHDSILTSTRGLV